jgi:integrase
MANVGDKGPLPRLHTKVDQAACRYELFDRNPIRFVRQSAKRRTAPEVLTPNEIALLLNTLKIRERTLVLIAAGTGLRQSELFGLKWGDIDFEHRTMNVHIRSSMEWLAAVRPSHHKSLCLFIRFLATLYQMWRKHTRYREF